MRDGLAEIRVEAFDDPHRFRQQVLTCLLGNEAHNCAIFGILARFTQEGLRRADEPSPLMLAAEDGDGRVLAAATMTRPYPIVVSPTIADVAGALGTWVARHVEAPAGVTGQKATATAFAHGWSRGTGRAARLDTRLGVYQVERLIPPRPAGGLFRGAAACDHDALLPMARGFFQEIREPLTDVELALWRAIEEERLFVWCDPTERIVSIAAFAGPTPTGVRVNFVYTPPDLRGRGYASNCVAALTRRLVGEPGRKRVFLFTDLSNATSNRIYQRLGYEYLGEHHKILFA
jgi:ribosomal protein S18 acetylase RimI-like enzyme